MTDWRCQTCAWLAYRHPFWPEQLHPYCQGNGRTLAPSQSYDKCLGYTESAAERARRYQESLRQAKARAKPNVGWP